MISRYLKIPDVTVIILNWNSWHDTIECLESVFKIDFQNFNIILIDNNSQDDSVPRILSWLDGKFKEEIKTDFSHLVKPYVDKPIQYENFDIVDGSVMTGNMNSDNESTKLYFLTSNKNLGFAEASNVAIKFCQDYLLSKYYYLLNNDTVVEPDVLSHLVNVMESSPYIGAAQSTIYHYKKPEVIANAGARIFFWGQTKYYKKIDVDEVKTVDFVNGCALFVNSKVISDLGALSEKYFFGEEDFEFSMRLKKRGMKKVCVGASKVYHKIGVSSNIYVENKQNRKFLIFALNRIIDMKSFYPTGIWHIWRLFALGYFYYLSVWRLKNSCFIALIIICRVYKLTNRLSDVRRETIEPILAHFEY